MPSQAKLDAAMKAVAPIVDADIAKGEDMAPAFARRGIDQGIQQHREDIINPMVLQIVSVAIDAADKVPA